MDDCMIIDLFFSRVQSALSETENKYGGFIYAVAFNVLSVKEDAEECVNDTYLKLWNSIPPQRPLNFKAYIGKITRNSAIGIFRRNTAAKRDRGMNVLLSELEDCLPSEIRVEEQLELKYLSDVISDWLKTLEPDLRVLFVKRYWYGESVQSLSEQTKRSPAKVSSQLFSLRKKLKKELAEKGVNV